MPIVHKVTLPGPTLYVSNLTAPFQSLFDLFYFIILKVTEFPLSYSLRDRIFNAHGTVHLESAEKTN